MTIVLKISSNPKRECSTVSQLLCPLLWNIGFEDFIEYETCTAIETSLMKERANCKATIISSIGRKDTRLCGHGLPSPMIRNTLTGEGKREDDSLFDRALESKVPVSQFWNPALPVSFMAFHILYMDHTVSYSTYQTGASEHIRGNIYQGDSWTANWGWWNANTDKDERIWPWVTWNVILHRPLLLYWISAIRSITQNI